MQVWWEILSGDFLFASSNSNPICVSLYLAFLGTSIANITSRWDDVPSQLDSIRELLRGTSFSAVGFKPTSAPEDQMLDP